MDDAAAPGPYAHDGFEIVRGFAGPAAVREALAIVEPLRAAVRKDRFVDAQRIQPLKRHLTPARIGELAAALSFDRLRAE
jgi:hypothetical protein